MCRVNKVLLTQQWLYYTLLLKEGLRENFEGFLSNYGCLVLAVFVYGIILP